MKRNFKQIILFLLAAIALICFFDSFFKYLSYESSIHEGLENPKSYTIEQYRVLSDFEKLHNENVQHSYGSIHSLHRIYRLMSIAYLLIFLIFLYLGFTVKRRDRISI